ALSFYKQAFAVAENLGDPGLNINVRVGMSRHHRAVGNLSDARDWANDAVIYATRVGYRHFHGMALSERGHAAAALGDFAAAEADLRAAVEILTPLQANFDLARTHLLLAWLLSEQAERRREATETFRVAARSIIGGGYAFLLDQERTIALPLVASYLGDADPEMAELASALLAHLERVPALPLRTTTLGRFEVQQGCRCIEERAWRKRSAGELFRLLLISPRRSLTSAEIVEALWSDKSPRSAAEFLHQATSTLRRILEPELPARFASRYVEVEGEQVYLHLPPGSWVDYEIFEQHIQTREWCAALALYQGDLFPGDRYADWVAATRERLSRHYLDALLATAAQHLDAGRAQESLDACHRVLERDPWQENAVLLGMRACLALNDRAGAIRLYRELERTLREELGVSPQPVLQEFCQSLLR
ncbi:MAG: hypothetical protein KGJ80_04525, partial [Chloroflexota bacterium]|nr:hypothetical protein [Chloroflexota bacterium]